MLFEIYLFFSIVIAALTIESHRLEIQKGMPENQLWFINPATMAIIPSIIFIGLFHGTKYLLTYERIRNEA